MKRFAADRKGAFAMQFALMVVPMTVCTGLAIDGGRAFLARYELSAALDAAALAVGSTYNDSSDLNIVAHSFVNANFHTPHNGPIKLNLDAGADENDAVILKGEVTIDTYFMPLIGQPTVTVAAESVVRRGGANVEVALALDVTGSMQETGPEGQTRIDGLKSAASLLVEKVVSPIQTPYFSKVAIAPWSASVHVGDVHAASNAYEDLRGTLEGPTSITQAGWRKTATSTKTITEAGWRTAATAGGKAISGVSWKNGTARAISTITKIGGRIRVTTGSNHGYATGEYVHITGAGGDYTGLNDNIYVVEYVSSTTYYVRTLDNSAYVTPPSGTTNSNTGTSQRCYDAACNVAITTSSGHTLSVGDFAHITGVDGFTEVNNADDQTWVVAAVPSTTVYTISGLTGPTISSTYSSSTGDRSSECYVANCRYRVTTSASHGFSTSDHIFMWNLSESGSGASGNSVVNTTWQVEDPSGSVFYLPGDGVDYRDWTTSTTGYAAQCADDTCNISFTSAGHGLAVGERVRITGATGLTGINNCSLSTSSGACTSGSTTPVAWPIAAISGDVVRLADTSPAISNTSGTYGSGGSSQCTRYGCEVFWFLNTSNAGRIFQASECLVERYGADAYTDEDPSASPLGINYTANGLCASSNYVTPLTSNRTRLNQAITDLSTGGATAGQLGVGWGWYLLSSNFDGVWDKEAENKPKPYNTKELVKVLVLMTDGEFNYATCNGVTSTSIGNCTLDKTPFQQAEAMCDAVKARNIIIYTVGLELDTSLYSDEFLTVCATSPQHAFLANSNTELGEAFKKIAKEISKLRIAM